MDKKKFLKIFEMAIESEEITEITLKIWALMGFEFITFEREKFNEIILFDGKRFYDEDNSPQWAYRENQKTLKKMWSRNGL